MAPPQSKISIGKKSPGTALRRRQADTGRQPGSPSFCVINPAIAEAASTKGAAMARATTAREEMRMTPVKNSASPARLTARSRAASESGASDRPALETVVEIVFSTGNP